MFVLLILSLAVAVYGKELAGYIDVSNSRPGKTEGSKLFYWFTPSESNKPNDPLIIWLQGKNIAFK